MVKKKKTRKAVDDEKKQLGKLSYVISVCSFRRALRYDSDIECSVFALNFIHSGT